MGMIWLLLGIILIIAGFWLAGLLGSLLLIAGGVCAGVFIGTTYFAYKMWGW